MKKFYVWLFDRDTKEFMVTGPVSDDTYWINRTVELQRQGRNVNCSATDDSVDVEREKKSYTVDHGYTYNEALKF